MLREGLIPKTNMPDVLQDVVRQNKTICDEYGCSYTSWMLYTVLARGAAETVGNNTALHEVLDGLQRRVYVDADLENITEDELGEGTRADELAQSERLRKLKVLQKQQAYLAKRQRRYDSKGFGQYLQEHDGKRD